MESDKDPSDMRSNFAKGYAISVQIMGIALEMVLPMLGGLWLDQKLGTVLLFFFLGFILGTVSGMIHLIHLIKK